MHKLQFIPTGITLPDPDLVSLFPMSLTLICIFSLLLYIHYQTISDQLIFKFLQIYMVNAFCGLFYTVYGGNGIIASHNNIALERSNHVILNGYEFGLCLIFYIIIPFKLYQFILSQ